MGMRDGAVQRIFLWRAAFIVLRGLAWGNAAGLALCLVQQGWHVAKLSAEGYMLSEVPVALSWSGGVPDRAAAGASGARGLDRRAGRGDPIRMKDEL